MNISINGKKTYKDSELIWNTKVYTNIVILFTLYNWMYMCSYSLCLLQFCIWMGHIYFLSSNKYSAHDVFLFSYWKTFWTCISYDNINVISTYVGKTKFNKFLNGWCNSPPWFNEVFDLVKRYIRCCNLLNNLLNFTNHTFELD